MNTENTTTAPAEEAFSIEDMGRQYFSPDKLADAQELLDKVVNTGAKIERNFNPDADFPEGFGLTVFPISKRQPGGGTKTLGVCVAAIPDVQLVAGHDTGSDYIEKVVIDALITKVANAVRPRNNGQQGGVMPRTLAEFLEGRRSNSESLETFKLLAPAAVEALKQQGLKRINQTLLRQCLQSAQFAENTFRNAPQELWERMLSMLIKIAEGKKLDTAILQHWADTRDETPDDEDAEITLDGFEALLADAANKPTGE